MIPALSPKCTGQTEGECAMPKGAHSLRLTQVVEPQGYGLSFFIESLPPPPHGVLDEADEGAPALVLVWGGHRPSPCGVGKPGDDGDCRGLALQFD